MTKFLFYFCLSLFKSFQEIIPGNSNFHDHVPCFGPWNLQKLMSYSAGILPWSTSSIISFSLFLLSSVWNSDYTDITNLLKYLLFLIFFPSFCPTSLSSNSSIQFSCFCYPIFNLQEFVLISTWATTQLLVLRRAPHLVSCSAAPMMKFPIIFKEVLHFYYAAFPVYYSFFISFYRRFHSCFTDALFSLSGLVGRQFCDFSPSIIFFFQVLFFVSSFWPLLSHLRFSYSICWLLCVFTSKSLTC